MLVGYVTAESQNFEDVLISAACKKKQGKLWQKERVLDGTSPLDKIAYRLRFRYSFGIQLFFLLKIL